MSLVFQANHVTLLSDAYDTLIIQDRILEANGEPHSVNGIIQSVIVTDKEKNTWLFTAPSWEYIVLAHGQHVHFEGPREYTEDGATFVCLRVSNSGGAQGFLTRQISSKAQLSYAKLMGTGKILNPVAVSGGEKGLNTVITQQQQQQQKGQCRIV